MTATSDTRDKINRAFAGQLERFHAAIETAASHGLFKGRKRAEAQRIRDAIPPTPQEAQRILGMLTFGAAVNLVEALGRMTDDENGLQAWLTLQRKLGGPRVAFLRTMKALGRPFYDQVVTWAPGDKKEPSEAVRARNYWAQPGQERKYTADIAFEEIFPHERAEPKPMTPTEISTYFARRAKRREENDPGHPPLP